MSGSKAHVPPSLSQASLLTAPQRQLLWAIAGISIVTNLLMLTGPVFMLQIYDRVLSSRSQATLIVLLVLVGFLYAVFGLLDHARARIAARLGAQLQHRLDRPVFETALRLSSRRGSDPAAAARAPQDLALVQQTASAPVFMALFDFPWVILFIGVIALLHPLLGLFALGAALTLVLIGGAGHALGRALAGAGTQSSQQADTLARQIADHAGQMQALGIRENALGRWQQMRETTLRKGLSALDHTGRFSAATRTLRLFLQSALLAAGALLVLQGTLSPGAMVAATIILGRALAPLDQLVSGWPQVQAARAALQRLRVLLQSAATSAPLVLLSQPKAALEVAGLGLRAPDAGGPRKAVLRDISFSLAPGQCMAVIGPTAAGKSMLAAVLCGAFPADMGEIRLDGARLDQYDPDLRRRVIGYLPQQLRLFDGNLRDNIARFDPQAKDDRIVAAAQQAGAHEMILSLPKGYATVLRADGNGLSGGQMQRIALARALFDDPALLVLDAPDTHLDEPGLRILNTAIRRARKRGACVLIMAHHPSVLAECDLLLRLDRGSMAGFGPVGKVLPATTQNATDLLRERPRVPSAPRPQPYPWELQRLEAGP